MDRIWSILANDPCELQENVHSGIIRLSCLQRSIISSCLMEFNYEFNYVLIFYLLDLSISERGVLKSPTDSGFIYLSLQFYQFLPNVVRCFFVRCRHIKDWRLLRELTPLSLCRVLVYPLTFFILKSVPSEINIATSVFFWWNTFLHLLLIHMYLYI